MVFPRPSQQLAFIADRTQALNSYEMSFLYDLIRLESMDLRSSSHEVVKIYSLKDVSAVHPRCGQCVSHIWRLQQEW